LAAATAEIERLKTLLAAQGTPSSNKTLAHDRLADVLQALAQRLARDDSPTAPAKLAKILDPLLLTDSKDPTFENWKLQIWGKLKVNADHFLSDEAQMTYVFSRTGSDA
jgi:hypothetical protein